MTAELTPPASCRESRPQVFFKLEILVSVQSLHSVIINLMHILSFGTMEALYMPCCIILLQHAVLLDMLLLCLITAECICGYTKVRLYNATMNEHCLWRSYFMPMTLHARASCFICNLLYACITCGCFCVGTCCGGNQCWWTSKGF